MVVAHSLRVAVLAAVKIVSLYLHWYSTTTTVSKMMQATKKAKGKGGAAIATQFSADGEGMAEVRYDNPTHAKQAIGRLNGKPLAGSPLTIQLDPSSTDGSKLIVTGVPDTADWQEVKDHFAMIGQVAFADVRGGGRAVKTFSGEVRYDDPSVSVQAVDFFNGSELMGSVLTVEADPKSKDGSKLLIQGIPQGAGWQELKDHFAGIGTPVAFANINKGGDGKGGGGGPLTAEVRYDDPSAAELAASTLDGMELEGFPLSVKMDQKSKDGTRLQVTGVNPSTAWQELKDHFAQCGVVAFADVKGKGKGKGGKGGKGMDMMGMQQMMAMMGSVNQMSNQMGQKGGKGGKGGGMVMMPAQVVGQMSQMMNMMTKMVGAQGGGGGGGGGGKGMKAGDWMCPGCNDLQFARNTECRKCGTANPGSGGGGGGGGVPGGKGMKAGDWMCPGCNDLQFARNTECRKCGTANPSGGKGGKKGRW